MFISMVMVHSGPLFANPRLFRIQNNTPFHLLLLSVSLHTNFGAPEASTAVPLLLLLLLSNPHPLLQLLGLHLYLLSICCVCWLVCLFVLVSGNLRSMFGIGAPEPQLKKLPLYTYGGWLNTSRIVVRLATGVRNVQQFIQVSSCVCV